MSERLIGSKHLVPEDVLGEIRGEIEAELEERPLTEEEMLNYLVKAQGRGVEIGVFGRREGLGSDGKLRPEAISLLYRMIRTVEILEKKGIFTGSDEP